MNSRLGLISEVFAISDNTIYNYITQVNNYIISHFTVVTKQINRLLIIHFMLEKQTKNK